jgi:Flp pilus assembly protein TadB
MPRREDLTLALAAVALVPSVFGACLPNVAEVRASDDTQGHLEHSETAAIISAGALVAAIAVAGESWLTAIVGGAVVIGLAGLYRSARAYPGMTPFPG